MVESMRTIVTEEQATDITIDAVITPPKLDKMTFQPIMKVTDGQNWFHKDSNGSVQKWNQFSR